MACFSVANFKYFQKGTKKGFGFGSKFNSLKQFALCFPSKSHEHSHHDTSSEEAKN